MYMVNKDDKSIVKIEQTSFSDENLQERYDLQEWIDKNPECLGEPLLIIQKEFAGFDKTNERLDLLALDTKGNIIVIENKRDDSGKDVTWQSIKYAAYCSTLTTDQIIELYQAYLQTSPSSDNSAAENLEAFLGAEYEELLANNVKPRIILVAKEYRPEVTASALWLRSCGIDIRCIKTTLYKNEDNLFFDALQIIPIKEAEDYMVKVVEKERESNAKNIRQIKRLEFWNRITQQLNNVHNIEITPSDRPYVSTSFGVPGAKIALVATKSYVRVEIYFGSQNAKAQFDLLKQHQTQLEAVFGQPIEFERLDDKQASRIKIQHEGFSIYDTEDYDKMNEFFNTFTPLFVQKLGPAVQAILNKD